MTTIDPGEIRITADLVGGAVSAVRIENRRPVSLASAFAGRSAAEVAAAVGMIHGLCGRSHAAGIRFAHAAATGETIGEAERSEWVLRLAAERLGEHLRGVVGAAAGEAARAVATGAAAVARTGRIDGERMAAIAAGLAALGIADGGPASAAPAGPVDALGPADDDDVVAALARDPGFVRTPRLKGRAPETGPAARMGSSAVDPGAARAARQTEIAAAAGLLALAAAGGSAAPAVNAVVRSGRVGPHSGFAAVETPRGCLHTLLTVQGDGRLSSIRVLAPTEWNFHPDGPLARCLIGWRPEGGLPDAILTRAAAFDPCVRFSAAVGEARDA